MAEINLGISGPLPRQHTMLAWTPRTRAGELEYTFPTVKNGRDGINIRSIYLQITD